MKKFVKDLLYDISNFFIVIFVVIYKQLLFGRLIIVKEKNEKIVHILANGPSLEENINLIQMGTDLIGMVNDAIFTEIFFRKKPHYLFWADPEYFEEKKLDYVVKAIEILENKVNWDMTMVIPSYYRKSFSIKNEFITVTTINIYSRNFKNQYINDFFYYKNIISAGAQNVVVMAIQFSLQKKFPIIYLHGVNNDWHKTLTVNANNDLILENRHFYGISEKNFTQDGFIKRGEGYKMFEFIAQALKQYTFLEKYSKTLKIKIINCTTTSMIDAFEKLKK